MFILIPKNSGLKKYKEKILQKYNQLLDYENIPVRGEDIPFWIEQLQSIDKKPIGLTGEDLFQNYLIANPSSNIKILQKVDWKDPNAMFGKPALCLLSQKSLELEELGENIVVYAAESYKYIARQYFEPYKERGLKIDLNFVNGCVELSSSIGLADLVIDIVYTGKSMIKYNLEIKDIILKSDFLILGGNNLE